MKLHWTMVATTCIAGTLLVFVPWGVAIAEAQTTDPRVADLVRAGKLRVGLFLPQYGKGPDGLKTTVWVETARAYAARVGVPLVIVEHATPTPTGPAFGLRLYAITPRPTNLCAK
jgi:hypothetical protein